MQNHTRREKLEVQDIVRWVRRRWGKKDVVKMNPAQIARWAQTQNRRDHTKPKLQYTQEITLLQAEGKDED